MIEEVRKELFLLKDDKYKEFYLKLCPDSNIIGVSIPKLRKIVKEILKTDYYKYLEYVNNKYYEETMIEGLVITTSKMSLEEKITYLKVFIPKIDNWSICDTICSSFKLKEEELPVVWNFILSYQNSNQEFQLRFMIVMMLDYFLTDAYLDKVFNTIDKLSVDYYYTNMAIAWLISIAFVKNREKTLKYLNHNNLPNFTYLKSLQKIRESNRISKEDKALVSKMRKR